MTTERELGQTLGGTISNQESISQSVVKRGSITTYFLFPNYAFRIYANEMIVESRSIGDYFVVGHSVNSSVSNYKVGAPADSWSGIETNYAETPITLTFRQDVAGWLNGDGITAPTYIEVGTGTTSYNYSQNALITASGVRKIIETKDNATTNKITFKASMIDRNDANIREFGLFNASSDGTMAIRYVIDDLDMAIGTEYRFTVVLYLEDVTPGDAMITTYGLNEVRDILTGNSASYPTYTEWSDGTGAMTDSDTSLDGSNKDRNAHKTMSDSLPTVPGYRVSFLSVLTDAELNTYSLTKSGLFTDSSGNTLFAQNKYGAINKTALFKIQEQDSITVR